MFNIPELDDLIYLNLGRREQARCSRVNKKWHKAAIPYLWRDLSHLMRCSIPARCAFRRMVELDFFHEQKRLASEGVGHEEVLFVQVSKSHPLPSRPLPSRPLSSLAKYGPWIRLLPAPNLLLELLRPSYDRAGPRQVFCGLVMEPTEYHLIRQLYKHCSAVHMEDLVLYVKNLRSDLFVKTIAEFVLPRVRRLEIEGLIRDLHVQSWKLGYLLDHCSSKLEELTLNVDISYSDEGRKGGQVQKEPTPLGLKRLNLVHCEDKAKSKTFWPRLCKQCGQLEQLVLRNAFDILPCLAEGIFSDIPNLSKITFGDERLKDQEIAVLLSSRSNGWKDVGMSRITFGNAARKALMKHCPTLERLAFNRCHTLTSDEFVQVISSSPNLRILSNIDNAPCSNDISRVDAKRFIDQDPVTGALKPWACENTLKELKVRIAGIPRPEGRCPVAREIYPGQGREIEGQVYERLARLTHLEVLWLGSDPDRQYCVDCLEMSLYSGLSKLAGMKRLKELDVSDLLTRIDAKDVQWMTEHWPELRAIYGLDSWSHGEALKWIRQHCPEISLRR